MEYVDGGTLASYRAGFFLIVPEIGLSRALVKLGNLSLLTSDVKDAPVGR